MAAAQPRSKQSQRISTGGRDILSRMLLMERQSKNKRASTSPIAHPDGQSEYFDGPTAQTYATSRQDIQPSPSPNSLPTHPALLPRSETWPILTEAQGLAESRPAKTALKIETAKVKDDVAPNEICLSPSWPDQGEKKRRKEKKQKDKEQKELDKKIKEYGEMKRELSKRARKDEEKEKQRAADVKAGKRLSKKPPPAAMETQKMPVGLRRNSFISMFSSRPSSREGSRRNSVSGDEKRLSGISLSSFTTERSQSTPATTDESGDSFDKFRSTVSPTPPQLPSFGWKSRRGSNETSRGVSWASEDAYDKEVVEFAYRLDASAFVVESEKIEKKRSENERQPRKSHFKEHTEGHSFTRSTTEPILSSSKQVSAAPKAPPRSPKRLEASRQDDPMQASAKKGEAETTIRNRSPKLVHPAARDVHVGSESSGRRSKERQPKSPYALEPRQRPAMHSSLSHDGSSYVQKQRLYQQQMSIASFEEQQTVQHAYELAAENEKAVGVRSRDGSPTREKQLSTPVGKAATPPLRQFDRQDSGETIIGLTHDSPSKRASSSQLGHPALRQPQKSTPLIQSTKAVDVSDSPTPDEGVMNTTQPHNSTETNHALPTASSKSDKILGFRKRSKPPPPKIWISEDEKASSSYQHPMSAPPAEPASKRSRMEKMLIDPLASQISFKKRAGSAGSATLIPPSKELFRTHTRNRTNSSEALTADLPSPVPWSGPINTSKPRQGKAKEQAVAAKNDAVVAGEERSELAANSSNLGEGIGETISDSTRGQPVVIQGKSEYVSKKHSPVSDEQKTPQVKELTRYQLVETIDPRAMASKAKSPVEVRDAVASSPAVQASTAKIPDDADAPKPTKAELEVLLDSMNSEGVIRNTSMTRPHSNPQQQTQTTTTSSLPSLDFLPRLKHQPLVKRTSPPRTSIDSSIPQSPPPAGSLGSLSSSPANSRLLASTAVDLPAVLPRSPLRPYSTVLNNNNPFAHLASASAPSLPATAAPPIPIFNRSSTSIPTTSTSTLSLGKSTETTSIPATAKAGAKPVAKLFVICCKCKFWHDLPSKLYETMALPQKAPMHAEGGERDDGKDGKEGKGEMEAGAVVVKCPWCNHTMRTGCCQGWTTVVYLHQRHH